MSEYHRAVINGFETANKILQDRLAAAEAERDAYAAALLQINELIEISQPSPTRQLDAVEDVVRRALSVEAAGPDGDRPTIVTLCGSTRFKDEINAVNARLTLEGKLVISLGLFGHTDLPDHDWSTNGSELKRILDDLHKRKIDLADEVFIVNVGGYIGESTRNEIEYAEAHGKLVRYLEAAGPDGGGGHR
jgi:hypothetical protein